MIVRLPGEIRRSARSETEVELIYRIYNRKLVVSILIQCYMSKMTIWCQPQRADTAYISFSDRLFRQNDDL